MRQVQVAMVTEETVNESLASLVAQLADNKQFLGRRYAEWCTAAPTLESAVAAAAMAQDEIGHARSLYPLLRDVAGTSAQTEAETRTEHVHLSVLRRPFTGWTDFVAANFLIDTALTTLLTAASDSSFPDLGKRARRMLEEEPLHWLHAEGWVRRLGAREEGVRDALAGSLLDVASDSLAWFDVANDVLVSQGVLAGGADELRREFRAQVNPVLTGASFPEI